MAISGRLRRILMVLSGAVVFWMVGSAAWAQGWASVDTRLLMVLHPTMGNFDYSNGRFFRQSFTTGRAKDFHVKLDEARQVSEQQVAKWKSEEAKFVRAHGELSLSREQTMNDLLTKVASKTYNVRDKQKMVEEYHARFEQKFRELDQQLAHVRSKILEAQEIAYSPIYLTTPETMQKIGEIKREIKEYVAAVAKERGISVVLDSSLGARPDYDPRVRSVPVGLQDGNFDVVSSALFHDISTFEIGPQPPIYRDDGGKVVAVPLPQAHVAFGMSFGKADGLKKFLQLRQFLPSFAAQFTPGNLFIMGGNDLTAMVAKRIFDRYQIPDTMKNSYMVLIRNFLAIENSEYNEGPVPRYPE